MDQAAKEGHEQCCANAFSAHICNQKGELAIGQKECVIEIPGHFLCGFEVRCNFPAGNFRQLCRQEFFLNITCDVKFAFETFEIKILQVAKVFLFETGLDARL